MLSLLQNVWCNKHCCFTRFIDGDISPLTEQIFFPIQQPTVVRCWAFIFMLNSLRQDAVRRRKGGKYTSKNRWAWKPYCLHRTCPTCAQLWMCIVALVRKVSPVKQLDKKIVYSLATLLQLYICLFSSKNVWILRTQNVALCVFRPLGDCMYHKPFSGVSLSSTSHWYIMFSSAAIDCGDPGTPTNGQRTLSSTTSNAMVTYTCDAGYTLQGSNSRTCQSSGQWSGSVPQCNRELI